MFKYFANCCLSITVLLLAIAPLKAQNNSNTAPENVFTELEFIPPEDGEKPRTKGAGTRSPDALKCNGSDSEALAIMPDDNYGLTTQKHPEIFILLSNTSAKQVVLSFESQDKEYHEVSFLPIDLDSKIQSFALPEDKPALESDRYYQWKLSLVCGDIPHVDDPIMSGWVRRKEPDTNPNEIANETDIELAQWYGKNGYWYDLIWEIKNMESNGDRDISIVELWTMLVDKY